MKKKKYILGLLLFALIAGCSYDFPEEDIRGGEGHGDINPARIVAVGDGYLAGVMDGALYQSGQQTAVPALIAGQMKPTDEEGFLQPLVVSENGFNFYESSQDGIPGKWIYRFENQQAESPKRVLTSGEMVGEFTGDKQALGNFAVPLLKTGQMNDSFLDENPYYRRIASSPGNSTLLNDILNSRPTLVFIWVGMNDYLDYAIQGALASGKPEPRLTGLEEFGENIDLLIDRLVQETDCKMVIANLIFPVDLPWFTSRPYNSLFLENPALSAAMGRYRAFNDAVAVHNRNAREAEKRPFVSFYDNGYNLHPQPMVVIDPSLPDASYPNGNPLEKYRMLTKEEFVLVNVTDELITEGWGSVIPISKDFYLSEPEIDTLEQRIRDFNSVLEEKARQYPERIALADIQSKVHEIAASSIKDAWGDYLGNQVFYFDGVPVRGDLGFNSIFSLDGLHFNKRGNAFIANEFIQTMNLKWKTEIPQVNINRYTGNTVSIPDQSMQSQENK